jgi:tetratricopeptide (TPR) repeat protein
MVVKPEWLWRESVSLRHGIFGVTAMVAVAMSLWNSALGQPSESQTWNWCANKDNIPVDLRIGGCTAVIRSGKEMQANVARAFSYRGDAYAASGDRAHAIADYKQAIKLDGGLALEVYGKMISVDPKMVDAYLGRAKANLGIDYDSAIADYTKALEIAPDNREVLDGRANAYLTKKEYDKAIADYDHEAALGRSGSVHGWLGVMMAQQLAPDFVRDVGLDRAEGARILFVVGNSPASTAGLKPDDVILKMDSRDVGNAADVVSRISQMTPGDTTVLTVWRMGSQLHVTASLGEQTGMQRAVSNLMNLAGAYVIFASGKYRLQRMLAFAKSEYDGAVAAYTEAVKLDPKNPYVFEKRGEAYLVGKDYERAIADFSRATGRMSPPS